MKVRIAVYLMILGLVSLLGIGCGDVYETAASQTVSNSDGETMTLTATPDNVNIGTGGCVTLSVSLHTYEGDGIEGADVYMTSTMGYLGDTVLVTDEAGGGVNTLCAADDYGWGVIVATYGTLSAQVKVSFWYDGTDSGSGGGSDGGFDSGSDSGSEDQTSDQGA